MCDVNEIKIHDTEFLIFLSCRYQDVRFMM